MESQCTTDVWLPQKPRKNVGDNAETLRGFFMAIDLSKESLLSFAQAAKLLPNGRENRPVNPSTLWRWARVGCRANDGRLVRLETFRIGGRSITSREALQRFFDALSQSSEPYAPIANRTPAKRERASKRAELELAEAGI
jgi:hypothetical protein